MVMQVITCKNEIGNIEISINYNTDKKLFSESEIECSQFILKNVPIKQSDNKIPIIFSKKPSEETANIQLLEDMSYKIRFIPKKSLKNCLIFPTLKKHSIPDDNKKEVFTPFFSKNEGEIIFVSFVGKTFLDIVNDKETLISIPIEVRSRKIDYQNQYPKMISDIVKKFYQLIYDSNAPLFNNSDMVNEKYKSKYELFMYLEYLFQPENLPQTFEYLSYNLNSNLKNMKESVPLSFSTNFGQNEMINMFSNPENLTKINNENRIFHQKLNGYIPQEIEQTNYIENIDTIENRFYKNFLKTIKYLIDDLKNDIKENQKGYVSDRLETFSKIINNYLSQRYFKEITQMEYAPLNSQVLQKKEGYRDIFEYFTLYEYAFKTNLNNIVNDFKGYEKKLSQLYEYWILIKLTEILAKITNTPEPLNKIFFDKKDKFNIDLKHGITTEIKFNKYMNNMDISLFYNLTFHKPNPKYTNQTYSVELRPDYTIQIKIKNKKYFLHFDAKYKKDGKYKNDGGEYKKEDIYKMHTYKDAIYYTEGSYVIYPGDNNKNIIFKEKENYTLPSVGAFSLNPGGPEFELTNIEKFIQKALKEIKEKK